MAFEYLGYELETMNAREHSGFLMERGSMRQVDDPFDFDPEEFRKLYRLSPDLCRFLIERLNEQLRGSRVTAISSEKLVLAALRFFATGCFQRPVGEQWGISMSQPSISRAIHKVTDSINMTMFQQYIRFPMTTVERQAAKSSFLSAAAPFNGAMGAIDCTHVSILAPALHEEAYVNHHGYHSINVQMICDPKLKILNVNARFPGARHDAYIWNASAARRVMSRAFENGDRHAFLIAPAVDISTSDGSQLLLSPSASQDKQFVAALVSSHNSHDEHTSSLSSSYSAISSDDLSTGSSYAMKNNYHNSNNNNDIINLNFNSFSEHEQQELELNTVEETTFPPPVFDFGMPRNITARSGQTAAINCRVEHLGDKSVSWIRKRDLHILTAGIFTYTTDERFKVIHTTDSKDWTLHLKYAQPRDSGVYECQVSTEPKMSMAFRLNVIVTPPDAKAIITGPSDLYVKVGSAITLTCHVQQPSSSQDIGPIYWYRGPYILTPFVAHPNEAAIDMQRISMESKLGEKLQSRLRIANAQTADSGNYTCMPTTAEAASVLVNVIIDENPAAMQKSTASSLHGNSILKIIAKTLLRWCCGWKWSNNLVKEQHSMLSQQSLLHMMHINCLPKIIEMLQQLNRHSNWALSTSRAVTITPLMPSSTLCHLTLSTRSATS